MLYTNLNSTLLNLLAQPNSNKDKGSQRLRDLGVGRQQRLGKIVVEGGKAPAHFISGGH